MSEFKFVARFDINSYDNENEQNEDLLVLFNALVDEINAFIDSDDDELISAYVLDENEDAVI